MISEGGKWAQSSRQLNQLIHQLSDFEASFVSHDLSNHGSDISALYHPSVKQYETYQGGKYHEDRDTLGFVNLGTSENKLCIALMPERLSRGNMSVAEEVLLHDPN